ncbi:MULTISPECIES: DUF3829 domain-containing protein [unclassified Leptotrichia]|jgi:UDP-glucose 4-epimerase|uniref:DUF3829 domain-containing protein n=1 Tax=unclassified Leptotrichia TaxID=2633022 RepID=UPI0003AE4472|nr:MULTISPECIES: DUF3829 domain-containing protein [unclassified Leptotrichia]ERL24953.1 hypothetical protein HMPREF9108_01973 [Leptotrichia sp. oral taxon 225 str. F0581]WLD74094.1 DUF3829 domain-containing protein [Leptotrichia sp. HMT-225]
MKKFFLLIFTFIFIFSCNNSSDLKETQSDKITEEEKVKFEKLQNMSPSLGVLKTINPYDDVFSEYDYKYSMYFRIKRGEKEEFFIPSEINIRELVEKYPVTPMEKKYFEIKKFLKNMIQNNSILEDFEKPLNEYFEYSEKKISKMKEIENYYKSNEYKKDNFQKGRILDKEYEEILMSYSYYDSSLVSEFQNLESLSAKYLLNNLKNNGQTAAYNIFRIKFIISLINKKLYDDEFADEKNDNLINQLEILGKDFKLAVSQAEKIKDSEIKDENMDIDKYKSYVKEAKKSIKNFYKGLKNLKNSNPNSEEDEFIIFEDEKYNNLQFYKYNEENEKMKIFYQ